MVKKCRVHRLTNQLITAKAKGYIADPAAYVRSREVLPYPFCRFKKIKRIIPMFFDPGCDGKNIRIKNNILGRKIYLPGENVIGSFANVDSPPVGVSLSLLVKSHDHGG